MDAQIKKYGWIFLPIGMLLFSSCKEIATTTRVFRDGSLERKVEVKSKSKDMSDSSFPIPIDRSWQIEITKDEEDTTLYLYRAVKSFPGVEQLQAEYSSPSDTTLRVRLQVELHKRFRWFYTFFDYRETYLAYNPFTRVSIHEYLTDEELRRFAQDDSTVKDKYDEWMNAAIFADFFHAVHEVLPAMAHPPVPAEQFALHKEALFREIIAKEAYETDDILSVMEQVLQTEQVRDLRGIIEAVMKSLEKRMEYANDVQENSYKNSVELPGLIVFSNADNTEGGVAGWSIHPKAFLFEDVVMVVESRTVNTWAVVLTVAAALLALALWLWSMWKTWRMK